MEKTDKNRTVLLREAGEEKRKRGGAASMAGRQQTKKLIIYALMAVVCVGCLYLIFRPNEEQALEPGLNQSVPQAGDAELVGDKEKAYEQELLEKKQNERKKAMMTLSDYWNSKEDTTAGSSGMETELEESSPASEGAKNYRDIQQTLGSFYQYQSDPENEALRREIREMKERERQNESSQNAVVNDPLLMMEKSYQMAAKYLPQLLPQKPPADSGKKATPPERYIEPVYSAKRNVVSSLYRDKEQADEEFVAGVLNGKEKRLFDGEPSQPTSQGQQDRNSIKACIHRTQTIAIGSSVPLRLLEGARIARMTLPAGTLLTATAMIRDGRLGLQVTSVEYKGHIVAVDLSAYDLDGQPGLNLPYSPDANAIKEIASGMSSSAGTNIVLSSSTGQQMISDLTKGVVQGTSGYLAKKIGTPKITVKSGYLLFLVPKKQ